MRTLIIALLLALPLFGCNSSTEERRADLMKGKRDQKGRPQDAPRQPYYYGLIEEYRGVLAEDPHNRAAIIALANAYYDSGSWHQAIVYYERALALNPHDADILTDLGTSCRNSGKPDRALQYYQKALRQDPDHLNARYNLGIVYAYDRKEYERAIREWEHLLRIAPTFPHAVQMRESIAAFKKKAAGRGTR